MAYLYSDGFDSKLTRDKIMYVKLHKKTGKYATLRNTLTYDLQKAEVFSDLPNTDKHFLVLQVDKLLDLITLTTGDADKNDFVVLDSMGRYATCIGDGWTNDLQKASIFDPVVVPYPICGIKIPVSLRFRLEIL